VERACDAWSDRACDMLCGAIVRAMRGASVRGVSGRAMCGASVRGAIVRAMRPLTCLWKPAFTLLPALMGLLYLQ